MGLIGSSAQEKRLGSCNGSKRIKVRGETVLTARQSEVALRRGVPTLCHCEDDGPGDKHNDKRTLLSMRQTKVMMSKGRKAAAHPGLCTISLRTRTASSLLIFSKLMSFTLERFGEQEKDFI